MQRKSTFINQVTRGRLDTREVDDVGQDALSYAEVKALASGDPMLLEKAEADAALAQLERLRRAHERGRSMLAHRVRTAGEHITDLSAVVPRLEAAIAARTPTRGEQFVATVGGRSFDARVDAAQALAAQLSPALLAPSARWRPADLGVIGRLGGFDVHAATSTQGPDPVAVVSLRGCPTEPVRYTVGDVTTGVGAGLVVRLENSVHGLDQRLVEVRAGIVAASEERDRAADRADTPFPKGEQLRDARARRDDVNDRMAAARAAETAPPVTADRGDGGVAEATDNGVGPAPASEPAPDLDPELVAMRAAAAASFTRPVHRQQGGPGTYRTHDRVAAARAAEIAPPVTADRGDGGVAEATDNGVGPAPASEPAPDLDPELVAMRAAAGASFAGPAREGRGAPQPYRTPRLSTQSPDQGRGTDRGYGR